MVESLPASAYMIATLPEGLYPDLRFLSKSPKLDGEYTASVDTKENSDSRLSGSPNGQCLRPIDLHQQLTFALRQLFCCSVVRRWSHCNFARHHSYRTTPKCHLDPDRQTRTLWSPEAPHTTWSIRISRSIPLGSLDAGRSPFAQSRPDCPDDDHVAESCTGAPFGNHTTCRCEHV